ncbi:MAG: hypothetical protein A2804_02970 [Candidatus Pacebacteria bacterium RIFCSPHIGHO2_01_FULL_46_10]|nr:MAG: hypothetical protein A2804_02970 [Candidatus Pacebacteria bacterium RIFCSPHIGHO2_01_FULL_46_10]
MKYLGLFLAAFITGYHVFSQWQVFSSPTDMQAFSKAYANSQYVKGEAASQKVDDAAVYTYAASAYMRGEDPTTINFEHPPLGKYLFGVSYFLTGNILWANAAVLFFTLFLLDVLMRRIGLIPLLRAIVLLLFGLQEMIHVHMRLGLMDLMVLCASVIFFVALFSQSPKQNPKWKKWHGVGVGLVLGALASLKYPVPSIGMYGAMMVWWYVRQKAYRQIVVASITAVTVYLLTYGVYFLHGHSLIDFMKFEWYRFRWWTGDRSMPKFLILQTLFMGGFPAWWDKGVRYVETEWSALWPVACIAQFIGLPVMRKNKELQMYFVYGTGFLILFAVGAASFGRYLQQLLPFWLIIAACGAQWVYTQVKKKIYAKQT